MTPGNKNDMGEHEEHAFAAKLKVPEPSVLRTCPELPSLVG